MIRCTANLDIQRTTRITSCQTAIAYAVVPFNINRRTGARAAVQRYRQPITQLDMCNTRATELTALIIRRLVIATITTPRATVGICGSGVRTV